MTDNVVAASHQMWEALVTECQSVDAEVKYDRYVYHGVFAQVSRAIWPKLTPGQRKDLEIAVGRFLRESGHAHCIRKRVEGGPPIWSVSTTWRGPEVERTNEPVPIPQQLAPHIQQAQRDAEDLKQRIAVYVAAEEQPVAADEVAHRFGTSTATARNYLNELVGIGLLFRRPETPDERAIRFGGAFFARSANLYSAQNPVPERTVREVVPGYRLERAEPPANQRRSTADIDRLVFAFLERRGHRVFTASDLKDAAATDHGTARSRISKLLKAEAVKPVGSARKSYNKKFRVIDLDVARDVLNQRTLDAPVTVTKTPSPVLGDDATRVASIIHDVENLTQLEGDLALLKARVERARQVKAAAGL